MKVPSGIPVESHWGWIAPHIFRHAAFFKKYEHSQKTCIYDYHDYATNTQHEVTHLTWQEPDWSDPPWWVTSIVVFRQACAATTKKLRTHKHTEIRQLAVLICFIILIYLAISSDPSYNPPQRPRAFRRSEFATWVAAYLRMIMNGVS